MLPLANAVTAGAGDNKTDAMLNNGRRVRGLSKYKRDSFEGRIEHVEENITEWGDKSLPLQETIESSRTIRSRSVWTSNGALLISVYGESKPLRVWVPRVVVWLVVFTPCHDNTHRPCSKSHLLSDCGRRLSSQNQRFHYLLETCTWYITSLCSKSEHYITVDVPPTSIYFNNSGNHHLVSLPSWDRQIWETTLTRVKLPPNMLCAMCISMF